MIWTFDAKGTTSLVPALELPPIQLSLGDSGVSTNISQYTSTCAHRTLGNWLAPNLQMKTALWKLQQPSREYAKRISASALSKIDAWRSYFAVFLPMMTYTLPVSHHSKKSLNQLQSAPTRSTLLKLGFNRHTAHAICLWLHPILWAWPLYPLH
jgi:hypothetical protein